MPRRAPQHSTATRPPDLRASSAARGYDARWRRLRAVYLAGNPYCETCFRDGRIVKATVVDHVTPHRGDDALRLDLGNLQSLCKPCHDAKTATTDGGFGRRAGVG